VDEDELAAAILAYLAEHPDASETLDGIAEWWLMRQQIRANVTTLATALRRLTERGVLEEVQVGSTRHYRLKSRPSRDNMPEP
jgi:Fe2+ or Zn2+ uptake regulation protein